MSDLLPREGELFGVAVEPDQKIVANKEKAHALEAMAFIQAEIEWADKQIDECDKISNLDTESTVPLESQVLAYQLLKDLLINKKGELTAIADVYAPKR